MLPTPSSYQKALSCDTLLQYALRVLAETLWWQVRLQG